MNRYVYEIQAGTRWRSAHKTEHYYRRDTFQVYAQTTKQARVKALEVLGQLDLDSRGPLVVTRLERIE